jgi:ribosomal protein L11 methylase PrmA
MIWLALLVQLSVVLGILIYVCAIGYGIFFGAPYVGTNKKVAKAMLEFARVGEKDAVLDIGCGAGNILMVAARECRVKKVIGYDVNPLLILWARIRFMYFKKRRATALEVELKARAIESLSSHPEVTVVTLYLLSPLMKKLIPILAGKISPNARVVSHGFAFGGIEPQSITRIHNTTLRLYAMNDLIAQNDYERGSRT